MNGTLPQKALGGAIAGVVATIIAFHLHLDGHLVFGNDPTTILPGQYLPVVIGNVIVTAIVVPILVFIWEPIKERMGR